MDPLKIYDYLIKTRERVFDAVRPLTPEQYRREFKIGLKSIASTLTHLMISEWYYIERLEQRHVPHYETWPIKYETPPTFDVVEAIWRKQAQQIRALVARRCEPVIPARAGIQQNHSDSVDASSQRDHDGDANLGWSRKITWLSFPDDSATGGNKRFQITCTAGDLFTQLALHEMHHRSQFMAMMREFGPPIKPLEDLDYNALMFERVEAV